jgi:molybdopterin-guanine dinucleotide biosynthesis protein A
VDRVAPSSSPSRDVVGIVLAGGRGARLSEGIDLPAGGKAAVDLGGRSLLERVMETLAAEVGSTIVVAAVGQPLPSALAARVVRDTAAAAGPLAGLRDGLVTAAQGREPPRLAFIAACDAPLLRREVVRLLITAARSTGAVWTVPEVQGHRQVLTSVVGLGMLPRIEAWLATGRRDLRGLCAEIDREGPGRVHVVAEPEIVAVDPTLDSFADVDTPADLRAAEQRLPSPG